MAKFRVHFEASAAIGVEIEIDAADEYEAAHKAQAMFDKGEINPASIAADLLHASEIAVEAYAEASGKPVTYVTVEPDENGFEIVDTFPAENAEPAF